MAKHRNGILGQFSGKIGPVVGSSWKDKEVMRARPKKTKKTATPAIVAQRARFSLVAKFLRSMKDVMSVTFPEFVTKMTARNNALKLTIKQAVTGDYPDFRLAYEHIKIARGSAGQVINGKAKSVNPGKIDFTWSNNTNVGTASKANDKAVLVAYCPELDACIYSFGDAVREDAAGELDAAFFSGREVHTWMTFLTAKGDAADSLYTGSLTVAL